MRVRCCGGGATCWAGSMTIWGGRGIICCCAAIGTATGAWLYATDCMGCITCCC